jgi:glycosyltransferase involved in cell wall biosynthesis
MPKIIIINDGSSSEYNAIFETVTKLANCTLLYHAVNLGKGRALKTAINHCLINFDNLIGMVTLDSDGQHLPTDVLKCAVALLEAPDRLVLGVRNFDLQNIPFKSKLGNKLTRIVFSYLCGVRVSDTQTGLRGIPSAFLPSLLTISGERFEYETNMLVESKKNNLTIEEVVIETVYIEGNKSTHFNPLRDSLLIYSVFLKYIFSSISAFVVDLLLFSLIILLLKASFPYAYIMLATTGARIISSLYNFYINRFFVFSSSKNSSSFFKYFLLAFLQMTLSGILVTTLTFALPFFEIINKIIVDTSLFFISFLIQRKWVFIK